jgi:hypothetical protein
MRRMTAPVLLAAMSAAGPGQAHEYPLQFTIYGDAIQRSIAGYAFVGSTVTGDCSYVIEGACSGRGCHPSYTYYYQGCTWDLYGNLLGVTAGQPPMPTPISTAGGVIVYAENPQGGTTGVDTTRGNLPFVNTISAQYAWVASPSVYFLSADKPYNIALQIQSIGDLPLAITNVAATASLGQISVKSTTCELASVKAGKTCRLVLKYDPTKIPRGDDPYTAYDHITVGLVSNSGLAPTTSATVETPIPPGG